MKENNVTDHVVHFDAPSQDDTSQELKITTDTGEGEPAHGLFARLKQKLGQPSGNQALTAALQSGNGVAAELSKDRRDMIERVMAFDSKQVSDVMAPRADIVAVEEDTPLPILLKMFSEAGHSRMPVYRGDLDDPRGMVHIKDLIGLLADPEGHETTTDAPILTQIKRKTIYVPPSMPVTDLLLRMQASRIHMALVIDEFGGTDGLVTIEDLIEEIVGEIHDEHDESDTPNLAMVSQGVWEASARLPMDELEQITGHTFDEEEEEIDTLGGLVFTLAGRVPLRGEVIRDESGFVFEILDADARKIRKLRFCKPSNLEGE